MHYMLVYGVDSRVAPVARGGRFRDHHILCSYRTPNQIYLAGPDFGVMRFDCILTLKVPYNLLPI